MGTQNNAVTDADKIRLLNDEFRTGLKGGPIMLTQGISERCDASLILLAVKTFDNFNDANDPHHEHDFGAIEVGEQTVFWKIDYYARDLEHGSPDATNPEITTRVLTVMLASEY
jgi:hypothetical protein